jgi:cyclopropane-fatty-acyl-phospholipid synthase
VALSEQDAPSKVQGSHPRELSEQRSDLPASAATAPTGQHGLKERGRNVAAVMRPMIEALIGSPPVRINFWDGSSLGPEGEAGLQVRSPDAIRRILWAPGELGMARAFVTGELDFEGDLFTLVTALRPAGRRLHHVYGALLPALKALVRMGLIGRPLPAPAEEAKPHAWQHSKRGDAEAISHHYDVGNDFYRLVLGPAMTYSCARFVRPTDTLEDAQAAKHESICRKLGLDSRPGMRLLDVGCGWGSMALHAARQHGAQVVGITISRSQADFARQRVLDAGLGDLVEIRLQDYRDLGGESFDAISSIGMFEHVGDRRMAQYFSTLRELLAPRGRLLNHAISSVGGSKLRRNSFTYRYVFPDGELIDVGDVAKAMEAVGLEVRDVESLREHYSRTLRHWVANLQGGWGEAVDLVGESRARVWLLYMVASAVGFDDGGVAIHQVLGVVPEADGASGMPSTRQSWN